MSVEHVNITDPNLHEPKGIAAAAEGTVLVAGAGASGTWVDKEPKGIEGANEGDVYVADGADSGSWQEPGGGVFGAMTITENTTAISLTAAGDSTLNTPSEYVKITETGLWASGVVEGVTFDASGFLTIVTPGVYYIDFWASIEISVINTLSAVKFSIADSVGSLDLRKLSRLSGAAGDRGSIAASGMVQLIAGAKLAMYIAADKNCDATPIDAGFDLILLKAD